MCVVCVSVCINSRLTMDTLMVGDNGEAQLPVCFAASKTRLPSMHTHTHTHTHAYIHTYIHMLHLALH